MPKPGENILEFTRSELLAVRLIELNLLAANAGREESGYADVYRVQNAVIKLSDILSFPEIASTLKSATRDSTVRLSNEALDLISSDVRAEITPFIALEGFTTAAFSDGTKWKIDRESVTHAASMHLNADGESVREALKHYRKALKRLSSAAVTPALRLALVGGTVALTVASGGLASAAGTFIGSTFMGLSGAAATSAGLAFLGGGSLAAGGFGMAGGTLLAGAAAKGSYAGAKHVALTMAKESAAATLSELAKLDTTCAFYPELSDEAVRSLQILDGELESVPPTKETRRSQRALKAEIRYLTDSRLQRTGRLVTRVIPISGLDRIIDSR